MRMIDRKPKASGNASASRVDGLPNHHSTTQAPFAPEVTPDPFGGVAAASFTSRGSISNLP